MSGYGGGWGFVGDTVLFWCLCRSRLILFYAVDTHKVRRFWWNACTLDGVVVGSSSPEWHVKICPKWIRRSCLKPVTGICGVDVNNALLGRKFFWPGLPALFFSIWWYQIILIFRWHDRTNKHTKIIKLQINYYQEVPSMRRCTWESPLVQIMAQLFSSNHRA